MLAVVWLVKRSNRISTEHRFFRRSLNALVTVYQVVRLEVGQERTLQTKNLEQDSGENCNPKVAAKPPILPHLSTSIAPADSQVPVSTPRLLQGVEY